MTPNQRIAVVLGSAGLLGLGALVGHWYAGWMPTAQTQALVGAASSQESPGLQAELEQRDRVIAGLQEDLRILEERLSLASSARSDVDDVAATEATQAGEQVVSQNALSPEVARQLALLRDLLPEKFEGYTLEELEMLRELDLRGAGITDADLLALASLTHLRNLSLRGEEITDAGLSHLSPSLETLELRETKITGLGLSNLRTTELESLHLCGTDVTGQDLHRLPPLTKLKTLKLNFLDVDDAAIESIGSRPSLRHMELDQTKITDVGLRRLLALNPGVRRVELRQTQVTTEGATQLAKEYPGCEFVLDSGHPIAIGH